MDTPRYVDPTPPCLRPVLIGTQELYEPLWIDLHARSKANGFRIRGIWIADVAQQGASLALNEHLIGLDREWSPLHPVTPEDDTDNLQIRGWTMPEIFCT